GEIQSARGGAQGIVRHRGEHQGRHCQRTVVFVTTAATAPTSALEVLVGPARGGSFHDLPRHGTLACHAQHHHHATVGRRPYLPSRSRPKNSSTACLSSFSKRSASPLGLSESAPIAEM